MQSVLTADREQGLGRVRPDQHPMHGRRDDLARDLVGPVGPVAVQDLLHEAPRVVRERHDEAPLLGDVVDVVDVAVQLYFFFAL